MELSEFLLSPSNILLCFKFNTIIVEAPASSAARGSTVEEAAVECTHLNKISFSLIYFLADFPAIFSLKDSCPPHIF